MTNYHPKDIENKWLKKWGAAGAPRAADLAKKEKFYALVEFPYPSGTGLHIGHAFTCTILDVFARKKRMSGFNVLYPMGWDAFGLPTENYAIRTGIHPAVATKKNTDQFRAQMKRLGFAYNWDREINTTDPDYYKWTQWIFIQLFKHNLAYKAETPVGWCPSCKIILANEEIVNGKCERCGHTAERRLQKQWLLRITDYADRLNDELDLVDYPDYVKDAQRSWIGRTSGVIIDYPVIGSKEIVSCYSTRPDTNFGATFIVVAPEHALVEKLTTSANKKAVTEYIKRAKTKSELERAELEKEKSGVFTGSYVLNRLTGKKMPIWVADFVVASAGTGAVVGVPAHDERDFDFAKQYGLEIVPVVKPPKGEWDFEKGPFVEIDNAKIFNSDFLNDLSAKEAIVKVIDYLVKKGWGRRAVNYHLRDWIFSRQHYWGEPIPMIYCQKCGGWQPVPEKDLPVKLPEVKRYQPTQTGESPLANIKEWVETTCPKCGGPARRETDTMPNWAGSSWYFLRYCDPKNDQGLADKKKLAYWQPVDLYLGGGEHTTLHLLYSRFWHKFLNDIGVVPGKEPYAARRQHGVILGEDGYRMSKSRGNVVNPEDIVEKFGADTLRAYLMFMGPYDATMPWSMKGLEGCYRFLSRIWRSFQAEGKKQSFKIEGGKRSFQVEDRKQSFQVKDRIGQETSPTIVGKLHRLIKGVGEDVDNLKHNTAIAQLMEFLNIWNKGNVLSKEDGGKFLKLLAPFAPYLAEELWVNALGNKGSIHQQPWPEYDKGLAEEEKVTVAIQVNGKLRGLLELNSQDSKIKDKVEKAARNDPNVAKHLTGKTVKKVIFVPQRLINFVV